jgi:hypothetical protein
MKWAELKQQGVRRCCACFKSGGRCRRRAEEGTYYCKKHGPVIDAAIRQLHCDKCGGVCKGTHKGDK